VDRRFSFRWDFREPRRNRRRLVGLLPLDAATRCARHGPRNAGHQSWRSASAHPWLSWRRVDSRPHTAARRNRCRCGRAFVPARRLGRCAVLSVVHQLVGHGVYRHAVRAVVPARYGCKRPGRRAVASTRWTPATSSRARCATATTRAAAHEFAGFACARTRPADHDQPTASHRAAARRDQLVPATAQPASAEHDISGPWKCRSAACCACSTARNGRACCSSGRRARVACAWILGEAVGRITNIDRDTNKHRQHPVNVPDRCAVPWHCTVARCVSVAAASACARTLDSVSTGRRTISSARP
jgi:hypothetical protein